MLNYIFIYAIEMKIKNKKEKKIHNLATYFMNG